MKKCRFSAEDMRDRPLHESVRMASLVLAGLLIASSAHAQMFDANGNIQGNVLVLQCQELPRLDALWTKQETDRLVGAVGYGFMHGYFVGSIYGFNNPGELTLQEQTYTEFLKQTYSNFMTDTSIDVAAARMRTFCADPENATKAMLDWLATWVSSRPLQM